MGEVMKDEAQKDIGQRPLNRTSLRLKPFGTLDDAIVSQPDVKLRPPIT